VTSRGYAALVTAAGASRRVGGSTKKEYRSLSGIPVLARAVLPFLSDSRFFLVVVTVPSGHAGRALDLLRPHAELSRVRVVEGGGTRQESVYLGLTTLAGASPSIVLIHDGARPWVSPALIDRVAAAAEEHGACVPVVEVAEAVKETGDSGMILRHFRRHSLRFAQTPQGFAFGKILAAHEAARAQGAACVDDGEVYAQFAGPVAWVDGEPVNRKITYPHDLEGA
jgi:2-C-methyl-D-erythritol 4-phosphate cytidylyltransferase